MNGRFKETDFKDIWGSQFKNTLNSQEKDTPEGQEKEKLEAAKEPTNEKITELLEILQQFDICFQTEDSSSGSKLFIVPSLLPQRDTANP